MYSQNPQVKRNGDEEADETEAAADVPDIRHCLSHFSHLGNRYRVLDNRSRSAVT